MDYRIYYGDGTIYEGTRETFDDAPVLDVQAIVVKDIAEYKHDSGRLVFYSWDFYLYEDGQWCGVNGMPDFVEHVLHCRPEKVLKGRQIRNDKHQEIMLKALKDPGFPKKSRTMAITENGLDWNGLD